MDSNRSCGMMIKHLHTTLEKNANQTLKQYGLTIAQMSVLMELNRASEGALSMKQMERALHLAQSTTAGIAARLEQKRLIESREDPADKRVKIIRITSAGEECCRLAQEQMDSTEEILLSGLTDTERTIFLSLLDKVARSL